MVFSSVIFIFAFLPATVLIYSMARSIKIKNIVLAFSSLVFYAIGEPTAVILMLISVLVNYLFALLTDKGKRKKLCLTVSIVFNVSVIFIFKYLNFATRIISDAFDTSFHTNILLPVGISFFTFQIMSYVIDVYRGDTKPQKSVLNVLLYISFFPQLIAGPIVKYHDIEKQIMAREQTLDGFYYGVKRFCTGLAKKVLIADILARSVDYAFSLENNEVKKLSAPVVIACAICYSLQIFFDFSGYSDIAIGMASMFGFKLKENFNYPYISCSIKEFWRRWHISLSTWFKEYVYIPLGGNRKGSARTYLNKSIVFLLTGIWHGANFTFIVWGLLHGFFIILEDIIKLPKSKKAKWLGHIYTLTVVTLSLIIFRAENMSQAAAFLSRLFFGWKSFNSPNDMVFLSFFSPVTLIAAAFAIVFSMPVVPKLKEKINNKKAFDVITGVVCIILFILSGVFLVSNGYSPNIYNQF